jgi:thiol:disulfide interchange protein
MRLIVGIATALLTGLASNAAAAAPPARHVAAELVAETQSAAPGAPLQVALREAIMPGWHTYWRNPGDAGVPTMIEWRLPPGVAAGAIDWPTPERIAEGPLVSYGYRGTVLLPVTLTLPADLAAGSDLAIAAHASWLVCAEICIPEEADLALTLPVRAGPAAPDPRWAGDFAATRAALPAPSPFPATASLAGDSIRIHLAAGDTGKLADVAFFPTDPGVIDNETPPQVATGANGLTLTLRRGELKTQKIERVSGVLAFRDKSTGGEGARQAIAVTAAVGPGADPGLGLGPLEALFFAFIGGLILNLMPCVLPVLAMKAFGLVSHSHASPREMRLQGMAYALGVLASFGVVAGALLALRAAGAGIGWGFQLQSPVFVGALIYLLFAVGLSLSGVFTIGSGAAGLATGVAVRESPAGSVLSGVLATLVATPCTAPFMAAALGYAIAQPWYVALAVFEAVGAGLALPYLLIAFSPALRRFLPKPGNWMVRLKQFLAFPVYGTVVWLVFVLSAETGSIGVAAALAGLVLIAFAAWLFEAVRLGEGRARQAGLAVSLLAAAGAALLLDLPATVAEPSGAAPTAAGLPWQPYSEAKLAALRAQGVPVFVDLTADWCITCKLNERVALETADVKTAFAQLGIVPLKGDWTRRNEEVTRLLEANGRAGVPLYLFYPKDAATPVRLPQILTAGAVLRGVRGG